MRFRSARRCLGIGVLVATSGFASAQELPVRAGVEEIVVTARKTEENIQDVPVAVTALSGESLVESSTLEMRDLGLRVPNLTTRYGPAQPTALTFQIRGQVQVDILGTLDPSIGFYDDGIYVARPHGSNASFFDVESVQVLRGPQGTLFGRNTTGGAVLLTTNDPDLEEVSGSIGTSLGSFSRRALNGVVNVPLWKDTLGIRVAGHTLRTDGYAFDVTNDREIATEENDLVRAKILYRPLEDLSFTLTGQYVDVHQQGLTMQPLFVLKPPTQQVGTCCLAYLNTLADGTNYDSFVGGDPDRANFDAGLDNYSRITVKALTLTSVWDQPWATLKVIGGIRRNEDGANHIDIDASPSKIVDTIQGNSNRQSSVELQLTGSWLDDRLTWAAGAVYFEESGKERGTTFALVPLASVINPIRTPGDIDNESIGGYLQASYTLLPKWRVTGGVRYSTDQKKLVLRAMMGEFCAVPLELQDDPSGAIVTPVGTLGTECKGTFDDSFDNTSWLASTDYKLFEDASVVDEMLVYFSVTTGYRAGGQNIRGTAANTLTPFKPETLMQFEGGFKTELVDRRVRLNAAAFHTLYDDIQRSIIVASAGVLPATVVSNAASAEITGAEIELTALPPLEGLQLGGSIGITKPRYNEFSDVTGERSGERFDDVPELQYMLSGTYLREVIGLPWTNRLDWHWRSETPYQEGELRYFRNQGFDLEPLTKLPPRSILNLRSSIEWRGFEVAFWARDLLEDRIYGPLALGGGPDFVTRIYNTPGRELGVDATYRF